jgi:hypothetical protein
MGSLGGLKRRNACARKHVFSLHVGFQVLARAVSRCLGVSWCVLNRSNNSAPSQIERMEKDIIPYRLALDRWVLSRRLALEQIEIKSKYLSKKPFIVVISNFVPITKKLKDTDSISSRRSNAVGGELFAPITQTT